MALAAIVISMEEEKETIVSFIDKVLRSDKDDELGTYVTDVLKQWREEELQKTEEPQQPADPPIVKMDDEYSVAEGHPL